jgi:hypothetical protein
MKKLTFFIVLFLFAACRNEIREDKAVVSEVDLEIQDTVHHWYKYDVYLRSEGESLDVIFHTDKQYKVGDTVYFSTNPQPCQ